MLRNKLDEYMATIDDEQENECIEYINNYLKEGKSTLGHIQEILNYKREKFEKLKIELSQAKTLNNYLEIQEEIQELQTDIEDLKKEYDKKNRLENLLYQRTEANDRIEKARETLEKTKDTLEKAKNSSDYLEEIYKTYQTEKINLNREIEQAENNRIKINHAINMTTEKQTRREALKAQLPYLKSQLNQSKPPSFTPKDIAALTSDRLGKIITAYDKQLPKSFKQARKKYADQRSLLGTNIGIGKMHIKPKVN